MRNKVQYRILSPSTDGDPRAEKNRVDGPVIVGNESRGNTLAGIGVRGKAVAAIARNHCIENGAIPIGVIDGAGEIQRDNQTSDKGPSDRR